jgi:hypothetical protein
MKHSVKDYLQHLDDMENWKGQQEDRRFYFETLKRSYGPEARFGDLDWPRRLT